VTEGTPCARRRGGEHCSKAQAKKLPTVAPAEVLATLATKCGEHLRGCNDPPISLARVAPGKGP
jgi:hypothetical protein